MTDPATRMAAACTQAELAKGRCRNSWYAPSFFENTIIGYSDGCYIAAASPDLVIAMADEIARLKAAAE